MPHRDLRVLPGLLLVVMLVGLDAIMMAIHTFLRYGVYIAGPMWDVTVDGGYPEFLQYLKFAWVAVLLIAATLIRRAPTLLLWIPLFAYLALDDVLEIHENVGGNLAIALGLEPAAGLRAQDLGELLIGVFVALFGLTLFAVGSILSRPAVRRIFIDVLLLIATMAFFAIGVDIIHSMVRGMGVLEAGVGLLEDGGEMVALSLIVSYLFHIALGNDSPAILAKVRQAIPGVRRLGREQPAPATDQRQVEDAIR